MRRKTLSVIRVVVTLNAIIMDSVIAEAIVIVVMVAVTLSIVTEREVILPLVVIATS